MNTVVTNALNATNEARQNSVVAKGQQLIGFILDEQRKRADYVAARDAEQKALKELGDSVISHESIVGTAAPTAPNANQVTILKAIEAANRAKQTQVEAKAKINIENVKSYDCSIAAIDKRIGELRVELGKLEADVITAEQVVG